MLVYYESVLCKFIWIEEKIINKCKECNNETKCNKSKLCEQCHHFSQRKVERPSYELLKEELETNNYATVAKKYGVSDTAIRKWIKNYEKHI